MSVLGALLAIIAVFVALTVLIARLDGLAFLAPRRTRALAGAAWEFCRGPCRTADGKCPLTGEGEGPRDCPLHRFIAADGPTIIYGSPFETRVAS